MLPKALAFILVTIFLDISAVAIVVPVMPRLLAQLTGLRPEATAGYGGGIFFVFATAQFFAAPVLGGLSDRFGRRRVLLTSLLAFVVDWCIMGCATSITVLCIGRFISGIAGATGPTANAYIADTCSPKQRAKYFGVMSSAVGIAQMFGATAGGLLSGLGVRAPFFGAATLAGINLLYGYFVLPESLPLDRRRPLDWKRMNPFVAFAELRTRPRLRMFVLALFLWLLAFTVFPSTWAYYCTSRYGWNPLTIGYSLAVSGLSAAIIQMFLLGKMISRFGEAKTIIIGCMIAICALIAYGTATQSWMIFVILLFGASCYVAGPTLIATMTQLVPENEQGALQGLLSSLGCIAIVIGPLVMTQVFMNANRLVPGAHLSGMAFFLSAVLVCGTLLCMLRSQSTLLAPFPSPKPG